jgi:tetratricopeptide (TPR) repeat protein
LDTVVFIDSAAIEFFTNYMVLAKFNAEIDSNLAKTYRISGYPTSVLIDKDGNETDRIVGYLEPPDYLRTLTDFQKGIGTLEDLLSQAKDTEDRLLYFDIAEKYKYRGGPEEAEIWFGKVIDAGKPTDSLSGESRMGMADMIRRAKDYDKAGEAFRQIMADFEGQWFAMDAEIYVGICHRQKGDTVAAIAAFEGYIEHFPESEDVGYAQRQIDRLKGIPEEETNE